MSKNKSTKSTPYFKNSKKMYNLQGKKYPFKSRKQLVNELSANLFLSVWSENGSFDAIVDRIENDKSVPPSLKLEVFNRVIASVDGFVQRFMGRSVVTKEEVEAWLNGK